VKVTNANELQKEMHQHGINYRLIGRIYSHVQNVRLLTVVIVKKELLNREQ
jgi:hypothetical protein